MRGFHAMLWPAGHSSSEKMMGQFSMVSRTPWSFATATISGQTRSASSQFCVEGLLAVAAHERVHERHAHPLRGAR